MEKVKILGVDASLRNTGLALITYNTELSLNDPKSFTVSNCQTVSNPKKYTGTDAILNMLDMLNEESQKDCYANCDTVIIESPPVMFNKAFSGGTISSLAHVSGGCVVIFGIEKSYLFRPNEWNKSRKKDVTHNNTIALLGNSDTWHYEKMTKENQMEHILDAASMALWWIKNNYLEETEE